MEIIHEEKMVCFELDSFKVVKEYRNEVEHEIKEIRKNIMDRSYNYGSTFKAQQLADNSVKEYLKDKKENEIYKYYLKINENCYFSEYNNLEELKVYLQKYHTP